MKPILRILQVWRRQRLWLALGILISLTALATAVALNTMAGALIAGAVVAPVALRFLGPARVVFRYLERLTTHDALFRALADLRVSLFRGLARAGGLGWQRSGDVLARLVGDVEALDGLYIRILVPLAGTVLLLPSLAWLIGRRAPILAVVVVALFALAALLLPWRAARATLALGARLATSAGQLRIAVLDSLSGLREVRAFGAEGRMLAAMQSRESALLAAQHALADRAALASAASLLCAQAAILAVLLAVGWGGLGAAGVAIAFLVVAAFEAIAGLPRAGVLAGHAAAAAARVVEAAETRPQIPDPATPAPLPPTNGLRFEAIRFAWPGRPDVFDGLTLDIPQGARVALLGPSGSGKSTLAALTLKIAAPQSGRVTLGGADLAGLAAADIRSRIGMLGQATHLFDDSIRANLLLAAPNADEPALWAALDAARIGDFVRALPEQLDTWLGESGARVSGGQGRRLALARALLSPCAVLILDEPCAGLDAATERAFYETLNDAAGTRSIVLIVHRLTGAERLDRIWRLSAGHAVAAAA